MPNSIEILLQINKKGKPYCMHPLLPIMKSKKSLLYTNPTVDNEVRKAPLYPNPTVIKMKE